LNDIAEKVTTVREHNDGIDPDQNTRAPGARAHAHTHRTPTTWMKHALIWACLPVPLN